MVLVLGLATVVFVADQLTKKWALARLDADATRSWSFRTSSTSRSS